MKKKIIAYTISVLLMIVSFILPPTGSIDPSVLMASGIVIFGYEWLFGKTIKTISITKEGVKVETFNKDMDV